ncbi:MAG: methionine aminotransferase [Cytophagaceae bacterium]
MEITGKIQSRLPDLGTTIFTVMSQLAKDYNAINLAQGFPDFKCSSKLVDLVTKYMQLGFNQYAPMAGALPLRQKIAEKIQYCYNAGYDVEKEITVTCGATEACFVAISSVVQQGDEVIVFEPAFDCYLPAIKLAGGKPVYVKLNYPDYSIDWNLVKEKISSKTKLIIINSPHNPTGAVITPKDIDALRDVVSGTDIFILSDEVYEHIIFDGEEHLSLSSYSDLKERTIVVSSFGKTFHTTGWRIGYAVAPEFLSAEFRKVHQYNTFSAAAPMQFAIAEFLQDRSEYLNLNDFYQHKRDYFLSLISKSRFTMLPAKGTYFQLLDFGHFSQENDVELAYRLTKEAGIACIPVSVFYSDKTDRKVLRFCFAKENETLEKAAEIICRI